MRPIAPRPGIAPRIADKGGALDYRARRYRTQENSYLDAKRRPYIHPVDGGLADNLGVRRLLDRAPAGGGLRKSFSEVGIAPGSVRKLVLITVDSERDPATNIDASDRVPGLADLTREWKRELPTRHAEGIDVFAPDAEIHVVQVNLRDAAEGELRRRLLQVPTAFSISGEEVTSLIEAGRDVLRRSPEFEALLRSLGVVGAQ